MTKLLTGVPPLQARTDAKRGRQRTWITEVMAVTMESSV